MNWKAAAKATGLVLAGSLGFLGIIWLGLITEGLIFIPLALIPIAMFWIGLYDDFR